MESILRYHCVSFHKEQSQVDRCIFNLPHYINLLEVIIYGKVELKHSIIFGIVQRSDFSSSEVRKLYICLNFFLLNGQLSSQFKYNLVSFLFSFLKSPK